MSRKQAMTFQWTMNQNWEKAGVYTLISGSSKRALCTSRLYLVRRSSQEPIRDNGGLLNVLARVLQPEMCQHQVAMESPTRKQDWLTIFSRVVADWETWERARSGQAVAGD